MMSDRYTPNHYAESMKDSCRYCHRPTMWIQSGLEKVCAHCGTRVYSPGQATLTTVPAVSKRAKR
ncbi:MAG: hypothetical protein R3E39_15330 [Anaerolineae bacterium]